VESESRLEAFVAWEGVGEVFNVRSDSHIEYERPVRRLALQHGATVVRIRRPLALRLLGVAAAVGLVAAFTVPATNGGPSYGVAAARDIMALIANRSPGERTHGKLSNTKLAKLPKQFPKLPYQFAKAGIHEPRPDGLPGAMDSAPRIIDPLVEPTTPFSIATPPVVPADEAPLPPIFTGGSSGGVVFFDGGSSGGSSGGGSSGGGSGGGGSSGGGSSGGTENPPPPPPPPVVPEPASWLMMITGIGIVGAILRRRRASGAWHGTTAQSPAPGSEV
jgi:uncharacterized membrane protein YgcG